MSKSTLLQNIADGLINGLISFNEDKSRITYHCFRDYQTSFKNPEERVRASYFVELVLNYQYPTKRIDIEVTVPRRTPEDRADIVVYSDDECKEPFLVVECKKEGITDAEFKQAIEQAFGNANSIRSLYASVVAGNTKTAFDISGFKPNERERNVIADIPIKYGKAPKYKFIKGDKSKDLKEVSREDLISALEKCHDTVWQGGKLAPTTAFDEVSKLLFCKMKDEKDGTKRNEPYRFQIGTHETATEVAKRIDEIYQEAKKQDEEVFKEDIRLEPKIIYSVVEHLQGLTWKDIDFENSIIRKTMIKTKTDVITPLFPMAHDILMEWSNNGTLLNSDEKIFYNYAEPTVNQTLRKHSKLAGIDKTSEKKVPMKLQAPRSTQLPSAYIYFLYGRYADRLPSEYNQLPDDLPDNLVL